MLADMTDAANELSREISADIARGENPERPIRRMLRRARAWVAQHPRFELGYRITVGVLGGLVAVIGLLLVPLPGPGWLIVFLGLAILGTEFHWARRMADWLKRVLARFWAWWNARRAQAKARKAAQQS